MSHVPAPNLLPQSRKTSRRRESAVHGWAFTLATLVLLIAIPSVMFSVHLRSSKPADTDHVTRFASDLQELQSSLPAMKQELAHLEADSRAQTLAQSRIHWPTVLDRLELTTTEEVRIHSFTSTIESQATPPYIEISIQTHTKTLSEAREYLVILEAAGLFDEIEMLDSRRQSTAPNSPVSSTIRAKIHAQTSTQPTP